MAKIVVMHDVDPGIGITLEEVPPGDERRAQGFHGSCTECGWTLHYWRQDNAVRGAQRHVDGHAPVLIGGDTDALVRS